MNAFFEYIGASPVAHDVFILCAVAVLGLAMGSFRFKGIGLGIAGILFAGLIFGHYGQGISHETLEFARDFGLILFVYAVGVQVGPGFVGSFQKQGVSMNLMAVLVVFLGAVVTLAVSRLGNIEMPVAAGLFSGATTNTPSLAAAQQALKELPNGAALAAKPGLGYAVAYPFGVVGIIITMLLSRLAMRGAAATEDDASTQKAVLEVAHIEVTNGNLNGMEIRHLPGFKDSGVVVSRVGRNEGGVEVARADTKLQTGDVVLAVGEGDKLKEFQTIVGQPSTRDLRSFVSDLETRRILVTRRTSVGKTLHQLEWATRFGVVITRVVRAGVELAPRSKLDLHFGDTLIAVGNRQGLDEVTLEAGNSRKVLEHPPMLTIFIGVGLGVLLGSVPIYLPGMPAPIKLGLAGGPLLVAIVLSNLGRVGPLIWHLPHSANAALREFGIALFLACVGLKSGEKFVETLTTQGGFAWMAWAALITLLPLFVIAVLARWRAKMSFPSLCGLLAGSMTDPPALAFSQNITKSEAPIVAYATVYPVVMISRIVAAQILVMFFTK